VSSREWLNVPNCITFFRLALVPVFVWLFLSGSPDRALGCFMLAAFSDALDGFLARLLNQRTKLGGILDPIADKLLIFAALLVLVIQGRIPLWLLLLLAGQNLLMIVGALMVRYKNLEIPTSPSRIGKYATFTLICMVVLALVASTGRAPRSLDAYVPVLGFISALCVVISTIQYFARFGYLWFEPARPR
jgi:cardiolipin synthase